VTSLLIGGWWLAHRERFRMARVALQLYAVLSLAVVGHYAYPAAGSMPISSHAGIIANTVAALALLVATPSTLRRMRASS
jgi:hypothetical protein